MHLTSKFGAALVVAATVAGVHVNAAPLPGKGGGDRSGGGSNQGLTNRKPNLVLDDNLNWTTLEAGPSSTLTTTSSNQHRPDPPPPKVQELHSVPYPPGQAPRPPGPPAHPASWPSFPQPQPLPRPPKQRR